MFGSGNCSSNNSSSNSSSNSGSSNNNSNSNNNNNSNSNSNSNNSSSNNNNSSRVYLFSQCRDRVQIVMNVWVRFEFWTCISSCAPHINLICTPHMVQ
eukprot:CAMPEP_0183341320 /NCGR_PEP_ID=MMETSP0164_2-20130417/7587_1 /TAXON_ID=221442 /ORGANISM="Coccolithus pelagicus ssp braarudi, Strain PLY182g" /LENGTH=97 /DNA_ID=CAMNT_0025511607 /DNA_START=1 /DNA_END=294 /DNA_ORIENTATION=+